LEIDDLERLVGRLKPVREPEPGAFAEADAFLQAVPNPPGQRGHCELDLSLLLSGGISAVHSQIEERARTEVTAEQHETLDSFAEAVHGLAAFFANAAAAAGHAALTAADASRHAECRALSASCSHMAQGGAPRSFQEAIQALWLTLLAVTLAEDVWLLNPGHLDRTLFPFYERDRADGVLERDEALGLIEQLYVFLNDVIPDGLAVAVMVGGRDAVGRDVTNDLSFVCLEALRGTALVYPTVGICWHEQTPVELVDLAVDLIGHGNANPAFFGDATIQRGLLALGVPAVEACNYVNSTCVEITPVGGSNVWVASPYFSTPALLLDEIRDQVEGPDRSSDFEGFLTSYVERVGRAVREAAAHENASRRTRQAEGRKPLQSVFTRDCIARARDIDDGGARYNWVECSFVGLANLTDSLQAVRREVFERNTVSLERLQAALERDFEGEEELRMRLARGVEKYGNDQDEVDRLFGRVVRSMCEACEGVRMLPDSSPFVPGAFCWIMHEHLGRQCAATPDGRPAGFPFADGCGPAQGRELRGPTASILSTTSWDHAPMIGGLAYNMKFGRSLFDGSESFTKLRHLVLTFLRRGGFETQINVVDADALREAREHPEHYPELVVRIGGYTDYFVRLSPEMQDEIILRTQYGEM
jgi:formate C-acetyltransferase